MTDPIKMFTAFESHWKGCMGTAFGTNVSAPPNALRICEGLLSYVSCGGLPFLTLPMMPV